MKQKRDLWSSRYGFVVAAAGSAVGLANVWAFPYRAGQHGGAAFVLLYLASVAFICLPFMFAEITLGRYRQRNVIGAIRAIHPPKAWHGLGWLCLVAGVAILSFYSVVAGWALGFIFKTLFRSEAPFSQFVAQAPLVVALFGLFLLLTVLVVYGGVRKGIERWSRWLMPLLVALMVLLTVRGLLLPGALEGLRFYLQPDFSEIDGRAILAAMGQAFFSLSLGIGGILTYGSYLSKEEDIVAASTYVAAFDTLIALLAGLMIFPALFAFGLQPNEGPALVFVVLPQVFEQMPLGHVLGGAFFLLLAIAALTSSISMLEISVAYFVDERGWSRKRAVWALGALALFLGLPSALSTGAVPALTHLSFFGDRSYLELMVFLWFDIFPPLGAILFSLLIGWVWGVDRAAEELSRGSRWLQRPFPGTRWSQVKVWGWFLRYVCPAAVTLVWLNALRH